MLTLVGVAFELFAQVKAERASLRSENPRINANGSRPIFHE